MCVVFTCQFSRYTYSSTRFVASRQIECFTPLSPEFGYAERCVFRLSYMVPGLGFGSTLAAECSLGVSGYSLSVATHLTSTGGK